MTTNGINRGVNSISSVVDSATENTLNNDTYSAGIRRINSNRVKLNVVNIK